MNLAFATDTSMTPAITAAKSRPNPMSLSSDASFLSQSWVSGASRAVAVSSRPMARRRQLLGAGPPSWRGPAGSRR